jgi:protein-tyrosine phosphatase
MNYKVRTKVELYYEKILGCSAEFGIFETLRRIKRELARKRGDALDISWVTGQLAIGAAPHGPELLKSLADLEISDVVDLRAEKKEKDVLSGLRIFKIHWVPTYDDWRPKSFKFYDQLIHTSKEIARNSEHRVLICCGAGEHRAPLAGAVALMTRGFSLEEAIALIRKARPVAEFLPVYVRSLEEYMKSKNQAKGAGYKAHGF